MVRTSILFSIIFVYTFCYAQVNPLYENLPVGKYPVGFKIITLVDSSRVTRPLFNYFGEKETSNLHQKIHIHVWYPAEKNTGKGILTYGDYSYSHLLSAINEPFAADKTKNAFNTARESFQGFFGPVSDEIWQKLLQAPFLSERDATHLPQKFPLLIGMLRPLSTTITNEVLASNGYVVAMVLSTSGRLPAGYITDVTDMQHAIVHLIKSGLANPEKIGTYGFSGSGFSQVLLSMSDPRIGALADIESALYGEGIWDIFSSSDLYHSANLRIPFCTYMGKNLANQIHTLKSFMKKNMHSVIICS